MRTVIIRFENDNKASVDKPIAQKLTMALHPPFDALPVINNLKDASTHIVSYLHKTHLSLRNSVEPFRQGEDIPNRPVLMAVVFERPPKHETPCNQSTVCVQHA